VNPTPDALNAAMNAASSPCVCFLEHIPYRPRNSRWRIRGMWEYATGKNAWQMIDRVGLGGTRGPALARDQWYSLRCAPFRCAFQRQRQSTPSPAGPKRTEAESDAHAVVRPRDRRTAHRVAPGRHR
jgi:hypothetical protein